MSEIDVESATKAYGCVNLLTWLVIILLVGILAAQFFGLPIGLAAGLSVMLVMLVATGMNIKEALETEKKIDELKSDN